MTIKRPTKKDIYAAHGIQFKDNKILSPIGWTAPLLKDGNSKVGKRCKTFSLPAGTEGTCIYDCPDCYAKAGFYCTKTVRDSLERNRYLVENHIEFVRAAIAAQIEADKIELVRIHASGDFHTRNEADYKTMWHDTVAAFPTVRFWTYTKMTDCESLFDAFDHANIVPSVLPHSLGFNFGPIAQLLDAYKALKAHGITPHVCRCGIDDHQHCEDCAGCSANKYVLFVLHSTPDYDAKSDPLLPQIAEIINRQAIA